MKIIEGNLLDIKDGIIMHQVNCIGATGGLAGALRRKWPIAFWKYQEMCEKARCLSTQKQLMGMYSAGSDGNVCVMHVFGQYQPGPNTVLSAVEKALYTIASDLSLVCDYIGPFYAPYKMGCGLGGGNWEEYSKIIEKHLPDTIIVRRPEDK